MRRPLSGFKDAKEQEIVYSGFLKGINQAVDENIQDKKSSPDAMNMEVSDGILRTGRGYKKHIDTPMGAAIRSIAAFFIHKDGVSTSYLLGANDNDMSYWNGTQWVSIKGSETIGNGYFDFINYQKDDEQIIILANGENDLYKWNGEGSITKLYYVDEDHHAPRGRYLLLHKERVWVSGCKNHPQTVFYSDDMDPTNWKYSTTEGGEIRFLTWNGDRVIAIDKLFEKPVVFKSKQLYVVKGTYPGEYATGGVFASDGLIAPRSVCSANNRAFYLSDQGIMIYDSVEARPMEPYDLRRVYAEMSKEHMEKAAGIVHNNKLYMALPIGNTSTNNRVIEYDLNTKALMQRDIAVAQFLVVDDLLLFIRPDDTTIYRYGEGDDYDGTAIQAYWKTPESDQGEPDAIKRLSRVYIDAWGGTSENPAKMELTVYADGKVAKVMTIDLPTVRKIQQKQISASGRRIGFKMANVNGSRINIAQIRVKMDVDED